MANKVPATLAPESTQWGRSVEQRLRDSGLTSSQNTAGVRINNARLNSTLRNARKTRDSISQVYSDFKSAEFHATSISMVTEYPFDPIYDASVTFEAPLSGRILIDGSGFTQFWNSGAATGYVFYRYQILDSNGVQVALTDAGVSYFNSSLVAVLGTPGFPKWVVTKTPGKSYTVRLRRWVSISSGTLADAYWRWSNITVTLLGDN